MNKNKRFYKYTKVPLVDFAIIENLEYM